MTVSIIRLYHPALWDFFNSYRVFMVVGRLLELGFILVRYLFFRVPILIVWTRTPGLKNVRSPWGDLQEVFTQRGGRAKMVVGEPIAGTGGSDSLFADAGIQSKEDFYGFWRQIQDSPAAKAREEGPGAIKAIIGSTVRGAIIEMGSAFIKFAQIISMRPECPPFLREELQLVQDRLPPLSYKEVRKLLEKEILKPTDKMMGNTLEDLFEWIDEECIGTASLAQVQAAKLRDGREVALKIQRPYLEGRLMLDKFIIVNIAVNLLTTVFRRIGALDISVFTSSYSKSLDREIDFLLEAQTQQKFWDLNYANPVYGKTQFIARPYLEYCTSKLLTMELVKNFVRIDRLPDLAPEIIWHAAVEYEIPQYPVDHKPVIFWSTASMWGDMILNWGFVHGDPHLGNLYVMMPTEDVPACRVFLCDFGMIDELPQEGKKWAIDFFQGLLYYQSVDKLVDVFIRFTRDDPKASKKVDIDLLTQKLKAIMDRRVVAEDGKTTFRLMRPGTPPLTAEIMYEVLEVPGLRLPDWLWLVLKSLSYLEELGVTMWGGYDAADMFMPLVIKDLKEGILGDLEHRNILDIKEYVQELTEPLNRPDTLQLMTRFSRV